MRACCLVPEEVGAHEQQEEQEWKCGVLQILFPTEQ